MRYDAHTAHGKQSCPLNKYVTLSQQRCGGGSRHKQQAQSRLNSTTCGLRNYKTDFHACTSERHPLKQYGTPSQHVSEISLQKHTHNVDTKN